MSVNNSGSEQIEDVGDLPQLYNRELMRKRNILYPNSITDKDGGGGLYKDWKAQNGFASPDRMISSLGRAIRNQGIISHSDSGYHDRSNFQDSQSNANIDAEHHRQEQNTMHHSSEPSHAFRSKPNPEVFRIDEAVYVRPEMDEILQNRNRVMPGRNHFEGFVSDEQFNDRCSDQCCKNGSHFVKSPLHNLPNHQDNHFSPREPPPPASLNQNRPPMAPCNFRFSNQTHSNVNSSPPHNPMFPNHCYPAYPPCYHPQQCCQNSNETPRHPVSPHKKCTTNRKTEASIKKLYRILWLQNEQLGLLEKQVSKLIDVNFPKDHGDGSSDKMIEKTSLNAPPTIKPETCEIGIMTDLPCNKCSVKDSKPTTSESEPEILTRAAVEESLSHSLTLHDIDIPLIPEQLPSPPASMHIDAREFQDTSTTESNESDTTEDESEPVGWTFYDNVVGQVNNILKSADKKKMKKKKRGYTDESMSMAVEQLRRLGLSVPESESNVAKRVTFEHRLKDQQINLRAQSEVSMNFNALASKYLASAGGKLQDISMCNVISSNTNMSLATMRYLERHQIANRDVADVLPKRSNGSKPRKSRSNGEKVTSKFLDITAIKQQPKLLPKDMYK